MGSDENIELVRFAITEPEAGWDKASDDLVWHFEAVGSELAGVYSGKDNVFEKFLMKDHRGLRRSEPAAAAALTDRRPLRFGANASDIATDRCRLLQDGTSNEHRGIAGR
jgi:hypothetical protein